MLNLEKSVIKLFSQIMNLRPESINLESSPDTVGNWDSTKHMSLILALEQEFGIQFSDEEIVEMLNVGRIVSTVKEKM